jgi:predicted nicotinamide N-methyase
MWPSAVALSRWLMTNPSAVCGKRVLEIGAGCGLTGLVAARLQKQWDADSSNVLDQQQQQRQGVIISDFNTTVLQNLQHNVVLNSVDDICNVVGLDFYQQSGTASSWKGMDGAARDQVDVVLAADMICQLSDAVGAANTVHDALLPGGTGIVVCADAAHRFGVDRFHAECQRVGLETSVQDLGELNKGKLLSMGFEQTAGYVEGMRLLLFLLKKPQQ